MPTTIPVKPIEANALEIPNKILAVKYDFSRDTRAAIDSTNLSRGTRAKMLSPVPRASPSRTSPHDEVLKTIVMICGAGLLVSLLLLVYGVDLSPGFF